MPTPVTDPTLPAVPPPRPAEPHGPDGKPFPPLTAEGAQRIIESAKRLGEDPLFEEWVKAVEEYRRVHNAIPDPDSPDPF